MKVTIVLVFLVWAIEIQGKALYDGDQDKEDKLKELSEKQFGLKLTSLLAEMSMALKDYKQMIAKKEDGKSHQQLVQEDDLKYEPKKVDEEKDDGPKEDSMKDDGPKEDSMKEKKQHHVHKGMVEGVSKSIDDSKDHGRESNKQFHKMETALLTSDSSEDSHKEEFTAQLLSKLLQANLQEEKDKDIKYKYHDAEKSKTNPNNWEGYKKSHKDVSKLKEKDQDIKKQYYGAETKLTHSKNMESHKNAPKKHFAHLMLQLLQETDKDIKYQYYEAKMNEALDELIKAVKESSDN